VYLIRSPRNASPLGFLDSADHPSRDLVTAITWEWSFRRCVSIAGVNARAAKSQHG
jgi:hypothetical protein